MPTLRQLITRFTADMSDLDRGYAEAERGANNYARTQERAHEEATDSAIDAGARIEDALVKPMERAAAAAARWVAANPRAAGLAGSVLAVAALAVTIKQQADNLQDATQKADEFSLALRKNAMELRATAAAAGDYGRELASAAKAEADRRAGAETERLLQMPQEVADERLRSLKAQYEKQVDKENALRAALAVRAPFSGGVKKQGEEARAKAEAKALSLAAEIGALEKLPLLRAQRAEDQAKDIAENEAANRSAQRAAYVIAAGEGIERQKRAAWAERSRALEDVQAAQAEYHKQWNAHLNVTSQVAAIEARYADTVQTLDRVQADRLKVTAAREHALAAKQAEAAKDAQAKQAAARVYVQAEQAADEYDRKRLEIKAKHLETLRGLEKAGASQEEYALAGLRAQNALKAVGAEEAKAAAEAQRKAQEKAAAEREAASRQQAEERSAGISRMAMAANAAGNTVAGAQWRAYDAYQSKLAQVNQLKEEGIDVTNRLALAEEEYRAAYLKPVQDQLAAYTKEIEANARAQKDAAMSQVGFTSLRGMWQRGMEAGARERFYEPPTADNATGREMIRQQKQITLLEGILGKLGEQVNKTDKLLAEFRG